MEKVASKRSLDPTVDVRADRMRMQRIWLSPLARAPRLYHVSLAREAAAKPVVKRIRPRQRFYFN